MRALVLSGGGSMGDFQVGALRYVYERHGFFPDLITSCSVGSINAVKLTEGPAGSPEPLRGLLKIWRDLDNNRDMWNETPAFARLSATVRRYLRQGIGDPFGWMLGRGVMLPVAAFAGVVDLFNAGDDLEELLAGASVYTLDPIAAMLDRPELLDHAKVRNSGIKLRAATVGLASGRLDYATEIGVLHSTGTGLGSLSTGILASASIPVAFPPVSMAGDLWVDGGVRDVMPVDQAVAEGATEIIAIACSPPLASTGAASTIAEIGQRTFDVLYDEATRTEFIAPHGYRGTFTVIRPRFALHDILLVEPGLIEINLGYGWMCAFDELTKHPRQGELQGWADQITTLRHEVWDLEIVANGMRRPESEAGGLMPAPSGAEWHLLRSRKREIARLVRTRIAVAGADAVPPEAEAWFTDWERHQRDSGPTLTVAPWDRVTTVPGDIIDAERPPLPLNAPQGTDGRPFGLDVGEPLRLFRDLDGDIRAMAGGLIQINLTAMTGAPMAAGDPRGVVVDGVQRIYYRATFGDIVELSRDPASGQWGVFNLTGHLGAPKSAGEASAYVAGTLRILYRADDGSILEASIGQDGWGLFNHTGNANGPASAGDPFGYDFITARVLYRAQDGSIVEIFLDPADQVWKAFGISAHVNAQLAAGDPIAYIGSGTARVLYRDIDDRITMIWLNPQDGQWEIFNLSSHVNGPPAAGNPSPYVVEGVERVVYRADDGNLVEIWLNPQSGEWELFNTTAHIGAPRAASDPYGFQAGTARVLYRDFGGIDVWELSIGQAGWEAARLNR
jgi:NTE family protein